ncbi:hypothetical protein GCM10023205_77170 [Yinghuangia aomiensis]|uniref:Uncharacterized protein n=1 Tax=Yinghuangia aomiensis TaxID=676205 RepID=A0ABP9IAL1_9ACTN
MTTFCLLLPETNRLRSVVEADTDGTLTGRVLTGLHEDILAVDPSGHDGADLWQ